jgi:hypothetical protein
MMEEKHTSDTASSQPRSEQENISTEESTTSGITDENKENVCAGNLDVLVEDAVKDLLNIVHVVSMN